MDKEKNAAVDSEKTTLASGEGVKESTENASDNREAPQVPSEENREIDPEILEIMGTEGEISPDKDDAADDTATATGAEKTGPRGDAADSREADKEGKESVSEDQDDDSGDTGEKGSLPEPKIGRLDRRLTSLAMTNAALNGIDIDRQDLDRRISSLTFDEKKELLQELLADNRQLRGQSEEEVSEEDIEALAEAKAEEMLIEQELAEAEREQVRAAERWHENLAELIRQNPQLDESSDQYDATLAQALELAILDGADAEGNPLPRYHIEPTAAFEALLKARDKKQAEAQKQAAKNRTRALSGAVSGATSGAGATGSLTWEDMEEIRRNDPDRYEKMIENEELPSDD
ncbi:MAG TPA: hypothetical protein ENJ77_01685 [Candidatus Moranbacteria bacterium]|nr:hypothetical protein [Candidatus Moranbacteria bacterium]